MSSLRWLLLEFFCMSSALSSGSMVSILLCFRLGDERCFSKLHCATAYTQVHSEAIWTWLSPYQSFIAPRLCSGLVVGMLLRPEASTCTFLLSWLRFVSVCKLSVCVPEFASCCCDAGTLGCTCMHIHVYVYVYVCFLQRFNFAGCSPPEVGSIDSQVVASHPYIFMAVGSISVASCLDCNLCTSHQFTPITSVAMHKFTKESHSCVGLPLKLCFWWLIICLCIWCTQDHCHPSGTILYEVGFSRMSLYWLGQFYTSLTMFDCFCVLFVCVGPLLTSTRFASKLHISQSSLHDLTEE